VLRELERQGRPATADERSALARWSGWGSIPQVFDERSTSGDDSRSRVRALLGDEQAWAEARRTTLNAHYTSADVVRAMWSTAETLGFTVGKVLEPGCGSGNFIGFAPAGADITGVECDRITAAIAARLYDDRATIHPTRFEDFVAPPDSFDMVIGNVPFAKITPHDRIHNRGNHTLHNYFLIKSLRLLRPGGLVVALTSRYTMDARDSGARTEIAQLADLVGAVRLPAGAFRESSGTDVVCDLLVLRRRPVGAEPAGPTWTATVPVRVDGGTAQVNAYFAAHPEQVAGRLALSSGMYRNDELTVEPPADLAQSLRDRLDRIGGYAELENLRYVARPTARPIRADQDAAAVAVTDGQPQLSTTQSLLAHLRTHPNSERLDAEGASHADLARLHDAAHRIAVDDHTHGPDGGVIERPQLPAHVEEGSFALDRHGNVTRVVGGALEPYTPRYARDTHELRRLIGLRDAVRETLDIQIGHGSDEELAAAQQVLSTRYAEYRRMHGPINRFSMAGTGRLDPETGEEIVRRLRPRMGGFRDDPDWPVVAALELFDDETQSARPAAVFTQRVIHPPTQRTRVDTAEEALAVCLDEDGKISVPRVADLLGVDFEQARTDLAGLVYEDPKTTEYVPAARYLSGNVRHKLADARAAVTQDERFRVNVIALEAVLPRQLEPAEITARLGAPWIETTDIERFCAEVLEVGADVEHLRQIGSWTVKRTSGYRGSVALSSEWGTHRADAVTLLGASLNQRLHTVYDTIDGKQVRNDPETVAAREKQEVLGERFSTWIWEDPQRAARLAAKYNELFSSVVVPTYDGSHLTLPGLAADFKPHAHQRDAVARVITDGRALLAHCVGAGKTAVMVMAAMEMRRLGMVSKPAFVVPNHMLEQFSREWLQLYPTARLLLADRDRLTRERRKEFVARCATGDWDGIVFTQSGFGRLPVGGDLLAEYLDRELSEYRQALQVSKEGKSLSVKRLEARIAVLEEAYKGLLAQETKDDGIQFEETGIDYLFVDEAHMYKNRRVLSSIEGMAHEGSQRAQDLDAKLWVLRREHGDRITTFATATPVANSMAELWVMQSYVEPDVLDSVGMLRFDPWAANFGRLVTNLELSPDGSSYRLRTRFARFQNVPELLTMYRLVADVRTAEDLALPIPELSGGKPETIVVPSSTELQAYVRDLAQRAEEVRNRSVDPHEDNMLKISGDGRRAALDMRLVGQEPDPDGGKLRVVADRVASIYQATREHEYLDDTGQPSPRRGALQLVFCDVSTPAAEGWNAYDELRNMLTDLGVPRDRVRFIHEATNDDAKAKLFAACRDGRVSVLIGSTDKMGVGTNVQTRAIALHHVDCPWRPADIEQREGRELRQGNQNSVVWIIRYATEGSFDIYMWQTVERKATFIAQVTSGKLADRDIDDIGEQALSYAEVKALATGNPLILEKAGLDAEVAKLTRLSNAHKEDQHRLKHAADAADRRVATIEGQIEALQVAVGRRVDTSGDDFSMTVSATRYPKRVDAGGALLALGAQQLDATETWASTTADAGELGGLGLRLIASKVMTPDVRLEIVGTHLELRLPAEEWREKDPVGLVQGLERRISTLESYIPPLRTEQDQARAEGEKARARIGRPFEQEHRLHQLRRRQQEIAEELMETNDAVPGLPGTGLAAMEEEGAARTSSEVERIRVRLERVGHAGREALTEAPGVPA
jgi:N12 class adenine-specific DNA methylase